MTDNAVTGQPALGSTIQIDDRTVLIVGQELDVAAGQPDVANVVLHRVGRTLFMIDTGATTTFRRAVRDAVDLVGPFDQLTVLITHGHPDHIANNDLADEVAADRGITAEVLLPAADLPQMQDPQAYWTTSFERLAGLAPLPAAPALAAVKVTSLFRPYQPFSRYTRTYEQSPPELLTVGSRRLVGWSYAGGAVIVLRSQGHCAGHVVVYLRDGELLHMGDELNGPCPVMHDADQHKLTAIQTVAADLIDDGIVAHLTDGHTFTVSGPDEARVRLDALLEQGTALQGAAADLTAGRTDVTGADFAAAMTRCYEHLAVRGANPNPVFLGMMAACQLQRLGYTRTALSSTWHAADPAQHAAHIRTAARLVYGAAATAPWVLRRLNRHAEAG